PLFTYTTLFRSRQTIFRRDVRIEGQLTFHGIKEIAASLIGMQNFSDSAGEIMLGIAQLYIKIPFATSFDFYQFTESQNLIFIAVLHQYVEVRVHHGCLIR